MSVPSVCHLKFLNWIDTLTTWDQCEAAKLFYKHQGEHKLFSLTHNIAAEPVILLISNKYLFKSFLYSEFVTFTCLFPPPFTVWLNG